MALSSAQRIGEIVAIRTKLKTNKALKDRINKAVSDAFSDHGIVIDPALSPDLIFALPEELADSLSNVILPGGTNC